MNKRRRMVGKVTSNKMMKTVVVEVVRKYRHPLFQNVLGRVHNAGVDVAKFFECK